MVSLKNVLVLCVVVTASTSTAQAVVPRSEMASQTAVIDYLPATSLDSTAVIDSLVGSTATAAVPYEVPSYPTTTVADSTMVTGTPGLSAVPAITPCPIPVTAVDTSSIGESPVFTTSNATAEAAAPVSETVSQPVDATQPTSALAGLSAPAAPEPLASEGLVPAAETLVPVTKEAPTKAPIPPIPRLQYTSKPINGTKIRGSGRLKLGLNATVDDAGNVRLGVKGRFQGNGTVLTKSGNQYKGGGQVEGEADIDTGINIGPMPNGGAKYGGKLDVGGDFEVEKPSKPSTGTGNGDGHGLSPRPTIVATPTTRSNDEVPGAATSTDSPEAVVPVALMPTAINPSNDQSGLAVEAEPPVAMAV